MQRKINALIVAFLFFFTLHMTERAMAGQAAKPLDGGSKPFKSFFNKSGPADRQPSSRGAGPVFPGREWPVLESPSSRGWIPAGLKAAEQHFRTLGATGLMIIDDGRVAAQWGDTARPINCHSVRKSFLSAMYGIEVDRGTIRLGDTMAGLGINDKQGLTAREKKARVLDLLQARSGVYHPAAYETAAMKKKRPARGSHAPGTFWYYNNWDFNTLGTIFRRQTGKDIFQAFQQSIAAPIGMQDFRASNCKYHLEKSSNHPAYVFYMSTRDRARFGLLFMHDGQWQGRQVIPRAWVEKSTTSYSQAGKGIGYGLLWWVSTGSYHLKNKIRGKAFSARGNWGQYIVVLPAHNLVVAMSTDKSAGARKVKSKEFSGLLKIILRSNQHYLATMGG